MSSKWQILREAILKAAKAKQTQKDDDEGDGDGEGVVRDDSVRRFEDVGLMQSQKIERGAILDVMFAEDGTVQEQQEEEEENGIRSLVQGWWWQHAHVESSSEDAFSATVFHASPRVSLEAMIGFNNTGNVCIWPSEQVLTQVVLDNMGMFEGAAVCEIGGGMASLAGLAVAITTNAKEVVLTDGNAMSVSCVAATINKNKHAFGATQCCAQLLDWTHKPHWAHLANRFDVILCADCCFFDEVRKDLVEVLRTICKDEGCVINIAPDRGDTREAFLELAKEHFVVDTPEEYCRRAQRLLNDHQESNALFEAKLHYPRLSYLKPQTGIKEGESG